MPILSWSPDLAVGVAFIDDDHQAFLTILADCAAADDRALPAYMDHLYEHTVAHFAREEALMEQINFFAIDCHKGEHGRVLAEMRRFRGHLDKGNVTFVRSYLTEQVPQWFVTHRNTMDSATAAYANQHQAAQAS